MKIPFYLFFIITAFISCNSKTNKSVENGDKNPRLPIAQTRKTAQSLFLTFDTTSFLPKISNKEKRRLKGQSQIPRKHFSIIRKSKERLRKHEKA